MAAQGSSSGFLAVVELDTPRAVKAEAVVGASAAPLVVLAVFGSVAAPPDARAFAVSLLARRAGLGHAAVPRLEITLRIAGDDCAWSRLRVRIQVGRAVRGHARVGATRAASAALAPFA